MRHTLSRFGVNLLATSALLMALAMPAMAATDAVVNLRYTLDFGPGTIAFVTPTYNNTITLTNYTGMTVIASGTGTVQVGTGLTPSVMVPKSLVTSKFTGYYYSLPPYTLSGIRTQSRFNPAATIEKSHSNAVPTGPPLVINGANATTICFNDYTMTPNGLPVNLANQCFPRTGSMTQSAGPRQYGGTMKLLGTTSSQAKRITSPFDVYFTFMGFYTAMGLGPVFAGNYFVAGSGMLTTTNAGYVVDAQLQGTEGASTTGMVNARHPTGYYTSINRTGSFALNATNLTGMISLVKPDIRTSFNRVGQTVTGSGPNFGTVWTATLTFLPEPKYVAALGFGLLALGGLQVMRKR